MLSFISHFVLPETTWDCWHCIFLRILHIRQSVIIFDHSTLHWSELSLLGYFLVTEFRQNLRPKNIRKVFRFIQRLCLFLRLINCWCLVTLLLALIETETLFPICARLPILEIIMSLINGMRLMLRWNVRDVPIIRVIVICVQQHLLLPPDMLVLKTAFPVEITGILLFQEVVIEDVDQLLISLK